MKIRLSVAALGAAFALAASAPAGAQGTGGSPGRMHTGGAMTMAAPHQLTVPLKALNGSGESGTAVLKDTPAGLSVVLTLKGFPAGEQPAHIHKGTCAKLDPKPEYPLTNVIGGKSTSLVEKVTLATLLSSPNAINVHKSLTDISTYAACGNIAGPKKMSM